MRGVSVPSVRAVPQPGRHIVARQNVRCIPRPCEEPPHRRRIAKLWQTNCGHPDFEATRDGGARVALVARSILVLLFVGLFIGVLAIVRPFTTAILFGAALATAAWPLRQALARRGLGRGRGHAVVVVIARARRGADARRCTPPCRSNGPGNAARAVLFRGDAGATGLDRKPTAGRSPSGRGLGPRRRGQRQPARAAATLFRGSRAGDDRRGAGPGGQPAPGASFAGRGNDVLGQWRRTDGAVARRAAAARRSSRASGRSTLRRGRSAASPMALLAPSSSMPYCWLSASPSRGSRAPRFSASSPCCWRSARSADRCSC